jgi:hypothetical protein
VREAVRAELERLRRADHPTRATLAAELEQEVWSRLPEEARRPITTAEEERILGLDGEPGAR